MCVCVCVCARAWSLCAHARVCVRSDERVTRKAMNCFIFNVFVYEISRISSRSKFCIYFVDPIASVLCPSGWR